METDTTTIPKQAMHAIAAGVLSEEQARQIVAIGPEAAVFVNAILDAIYKRPLA